MMRNILLLSLLPLYIISCNPEPSFVLTGTVSDTDERLIYLEKRERGLWVTIDSTMIMGGEFRFEGRVDYPSARYLRIEGKRGYKMLFLENQNISVRGSADTLFALSVAGSVTDYEYELYSKEIENLYNDSSILSSELQPAFDVKDKNRISEIENRIQEYKMEFILKNRSSYATPLILRSLSSDLDVDSLERSIDKLDPILSETSIVLGLKETVQKMRLLEPGKMAPDFTQSENDGSKISLSDVIGEGPILLEFWSSWSVQSRNEHPELVALFNKYRVSGFKIVGISLDSNMEDWTKAILEDKLDWIHLSDLRFWNNEVALLYNINEIPANYLLDKDGIIVASNLKPEKLDAMIGSLIANSEMN